MDDAAETGGTWVPWSGGGGSDAFQPLEAPPGRFDLSTEATFVWEVRPEVFQPERFARSLLRARSSHDRTAGAVAKLVIACVALVGVVAWASGGSAALLVPVFAYVAIVALIVVLARRRSAILTARNLSSGLYAGSHGYRVGPRGIHSGDGATWSASHAWRHFLWAALQDEVIVLRSAAGGFHVLPNAALVTPAAPADVVRQIQAWIEAARVG